jgi:hypothetical protein
VPGSAGGSRPARTQFADLTGLFLNQADRDRVAINLCGANAKLYFRLLQAQRHDIEWHEMPDGQENRIAYYLNEVDVENRAPRAASISRPIFLAGLQLSSLTAIPQVRLAGLRHRNRGRRYGRRCARLAVEGQISTALVACVFEQKRAKPRDRTRSARRWAFATLTFNGVGWVRRKCLSNGGFAGL